MEVDANKPHPQTTPLNDDQTVLGSIQVEAYNWKEYCGGCTEPLLAMRIRATKAKSINLPKGYDIVCICTPLYYMYTVLYLYCICIVLHVYVHVVYYNRQVLLRL